MDSEGFSMSTGGSDLYGDDANQPNYGGDEAVFGSSPYSIHGGGLVNAWALKDTTSALWWLRMANEALMIVCMIFLFAAVWFQNDAAHNLTQWATAVLIACAVSNELLDYTSNAQMLDKNLDLAMKGGAGLLTVGGLFAGSFWATF